jgi:hypothetical protein
MKFSFYTEKVKHAKHHTDKKRERETATIRANNKDHYERWEAEW